MVTPPEVFSGITYPLIFTEKEVSNLELASYLCNLETDDMSHAKDMYMAGLLTESDMNAIHNITYQTTPMEQIRDSLIAATDNEAECHDFVLSGLKAYVELQAESQTMKYEFRPNTALQRKTILAIPYEELDSLESFFDSVSLLVCKGTAKLIGKTAAKIGIEVPDVKRQLQFMKKSEGTNWFRHKRV